MGVIIGTAEEILFIKQLASKEDLLLGFGTVIQVREGESVEVTLINASSIPYSATTSVAEEILAIKTQLGLA